MNMKRDVETFRVELRNFKESPWQDLYHNWLTLSWPKSFLLFVLLFLVLNLFFATLFWILGEGALTNTSGSFIDCFFFSVQTLGTIGYGSMAPLSFAANVIVVLEAALGMVTIALLSGLFFAKFSQARARIRFTEKMLITKHNSKPSLQFRMANERVNRIVDAKVTMTLLKPEISPEGMRMRKAYELDLELSHAPMFAMSFTAMHDLSSGLLKDIKLNQMCDEGYEFYVTIVGTDGTFGQTIYSTKIYTALDVIDRAQWAQIGEITPDGRRIVDLEKFDELIPENN